MLCPFFYERTDDFLFFLIRNGLRLVSWPIVWWFTKLPSAVQKHPAPHFNGMHLQITAYLKVWDKKKKHSILKCP